MSSSSQVNHILERFEQSVKDVPLSAAIEYKQSVMTYLELQTQSSQLANRLLELGIVPQQKIIVCLPESPNAFVAMLGILKLRCIYVPLAPNSPIAWKRNILQAANAALVISEDSFSDLMTASTNQAVQSPSFLRNLSDIMYEIYTSGSTGQPKCIPISYTNFAGFLPKLTSVMEYTHHDRWLQSHSLAFGFSLWEIWGALSHGACLVCLPQKANRTSAELCDFLTENRISIWSQTPTAFLQFLAGLENESQLNSLPLRRIAISGEAITAAACNKWFRHGNASTRLISLYALSETAGPVAYHELDPQGADSDLSVLGTPLSNVHFRLSKTNERKSNHLQEIQLKGDFLSPSLLLQDGWYATGDFAYPLESGAIIYHGRKNKFLKIRGTRVNVQGIAHWLSEQELIQDAHVYYDESTQLLVAMCLSSADLDLSKIKQSLRDQFHESHQPDFWRTYRQWPLTANGKLKRPTLSDENSLNQALTQQRLGEIWATLLQVESIQAKDNFFLKGGHSLLAMRLLSQLKTEFNLNLDLSLLLKNPVAADFFNAIQTESIRENRTSTPTTNPHQKWMRLILDRALESVASGQVPYAAALVNRQQLLALQHNQVKTKHILAHAEMQALSKALDQGQEPNLKGATLYSTVEPCSMCLSAAYWAGVKQIVYSLSMKDEYRLGLSKRQSLAAVELNASFTSPLKLTENYMAEEMIDICEQWLNQLETPLPYA